MKMDVRLRLDRLLRALRLKAHGLAEEAERLAALRERDEAEERE